MAALPTEQVAQWHCQYCVSGEAIFFRKALLPARFRYETQKGLEYWKTPMPFERPASSALEWFVPAHFQCAYSLTKTGLDRLLCRIPACYRRLETPQGFHFEMETAFSYKAQDFVDVA